MRESTAASTEGSGEGGYGLATTALLFIPLMIFAALAVDVGGWYSGASQIQRAADGAALAAVVHMSNETKATLAALEVAAANGFVDQPGCPADGIDDLRIRNPQGNYVPVPWYGIDCLDYNYQNRPTHPRSSVTQAPRRAGATKPLPKAEKLRRPSPLKGPSDETSALSVLLVLPVGGSREPQRTTP